jgi:predicted ATP-binding protein involved in virulence
MDIFPNTQFIVTTHSPQVLTSIRNQHIRLLLNGQVFQPTNDSYGAESWRVLEHILNVSSRPKNEVSDIIDKYLDLINAGQGKSEEGQKLREQLEEWIPNDPILTDMDYFINLNEVMVDTK